MTDQITAEEYRAYASVWWHTNGRMTGAEAVDAANDLEFGAATAALVNELAQILSKQWGDDEWVEVGDPGREEYAGGVRAILAHLRPIAEWLIAEKAWKVTVTAGPWPTVADIPVGVDRVRDHGGIEWRRDCAGWWSPDALDAGIAYAPAPFSRVEVSA